MAVIASSEAIWTKHIYDRMVIKAEEESSRYEAGSALRPGFPDRAQGEESQHADDGERTPLLSRAEIPSDDWLLRISSFLFEPQ